MDEHYKQELLKLVDPWTPDQLDNYIKELEVRIDNIRDQIRELKSLKRRKLKNSNLKNNGQRGGM